MKKKPKEEVDFMNPDNHRVVRMWPRSDMEYIKGKLSPVIICSCSHQYAPDFSNVKGRFDGVDVINDLLDHFNAHLVSVKKRWGEYDTGPNNGKSGY